MARIRNRDALATTVARRDALDIVEAGLTAVDTEAVVRARVRLDGDTLRIGDRSWDLFRFRHVHLIGFGKASCAAAVALEEILGPRLSRGIALGNTPRICRTIDICEATHPLPSPRNAELSERLVRACEQVAPGDLVLVVISGGGSAMLCWPASECEQGIRLYAAANRAGLDVAALNTVRKHLSLLKGGGLAKLLHPATVVGLVFSDIPGGHPDMVASGPTYPDTTTIADARAVIDRYALGEFELLETPKDLRYFANVTNTVLVTNRTALDAMAARAASLGWRPVIVGDDLTESSEQVVARMRAAAAPGTAVIAGGEPSIAIPERHGTGGRNQHTALTAALALGDTQVFASVASDGMDNGPHGGALTDTGTPARAHDTGMDPAAHLQRSDEEPLLRATGDLLDIGPTGANVSDLLLLLTPR